MVDLSSDRQNGPHRDSDRASLSTLAQQIGAGTLSSEALVEACLARIAARDAVVRAWSHLDGEQAAPTHGFDGIVGLAERRIGGPSRAPQHGNAEIVEGALESSDRSFGRVSSLAVRRERPSRENYSTSYKATAGNRESTSSPPWFAISNRPRRSPF